MKLICIIICTFLSETILARQNQDPSAEPGKGIHIVFHPKTFSNSFSLNIDPVITIREGDTVETETIDAGGYDQQGVKRQRGGNPLTGPFLCGPGQRQEISWRSVC